MLPAFPAPAMIGSVRAGDILLMESPGGLRLYDRFEQRVTDTDAVGVVSFVPVRILEVHAYLSDGLTPCIKVEINNAVHYLIRDPGTLGVIGEDAVGYTRKVEGAVLLHDTIAVLKAGSIRWTSPKGGAGGVCPAGERLARHFAAGDLCYVGLLDRPGTFGWVRLPGTTRGGTWDAAGTAAAGPAGISLRLRDGVAGKIRETNLVLSSLYRSIVDRTVRREAIPQWQIVVSDSAITCILVPLPADSARESSGLLARQLENLTLGTAYRVSARAGRIEIMR